MRRPASVPKPVLDTVVPIMLMSSRATAPSAAAVSQRPLVCAHLFAFMLSQDVFLHVAVRKRAMSLTFKSDHDLHAQGWKDANAKLFSDTQRARISTLAKTHLCPRLLRTPSCNTCHRRGILLLPAISPAVFMPKGRECFAGNIGSKACAIWHSRSKGVASVGAVACARFMALWRQDLSIAPRTRRGARLKRGAFRISCGRAASIRTGATECHPLARRVKLEQSCAACTHTRATSGCERFRRALC